MELHARPREQSDGPGGQPRRSIRARPAGAQCSLVRIYDRPNQIPQISGGSCGRLQSDGRYLALVSASGVLSIWDIQPQGAVLDQGPNPIREVRFSQGRSRLA